MHILRRIGHRTALGESQMSEQTLASGVTLSAIIMSSALCATSGAQDESVAQIRAELDSIRSENREMRAQMLQMRSEQSDKWLTEQRAAEIRTIVTDVLADSHSRTNLQGAGATSGYSNGFFIASADGNFRLGLAILAQARFTWNYRPGSNIGTVPGNTVNDVPTISGAGSSESQWNFENRRSQIGFSGNVMDPSWTYMARLNYGSAVDPYTPQSGQMTLQDAWIAKDFGNGLSLKVGQFKSPFMAESLRNDGAQLTAERSVVDYYFSGGYTQGVLLTYAQDSWRVSGSYNDGPRSQNTSWAGGTVGGVPANAAISLAARAEFKVMGAWSQFDTESSQNSDESALMIGVAIQYYNNRGGSSGTGYFPQVGSPVYGSALFDTNFSTTGAIDWTVDATFKSGGLSLSGAFIGSHYGLSRSAGGSPFGQPVTDFSSYGMVLQGGYRFTEMLEGFSRWEWYNVANAANTPSSTDGLDATDVNNILTFGVNVHFGTNIKWTSQFGISLGSTVGSNEGLNLTGAGYQQDANTTSRNQMNFITQLQLMF